jgi:hypothetical protein
MLVYKDPTQSLPYDDSVALSFKLPVCGAAAE